LLLCAGVRPARLLRLLPLVGGPDPLHLHHRGD
jgi:hypothetical protein